MKPNCIFCSIIARTTPAEILFENEDALCILDINPIHYGHSLVIPKLHCRDFLDLPPSAFDGILSAVHTVARATVKSLSLEEAFVTITKENINLFAGIGGRE